MDGTNGNHAGGREPRMLALVPFGLGANRLTQMMIDTSVDGTIKLGRANLLQEQDDVAAKHCEFISRNHVEIHVRAGLVYMQNVARQDRLVNRNGVTCGREEVELVPGDVFSFLGALQYYNYRLEPNAPTVPDPPQGQQEQGQGIGQGQGQGLGQWQAQGQLWPQPQQQAAQEIPPPLSFGASATPRSVEVTDLTDQWRSPELVPYSSHAAASTSTSASASASASAASRRGTGHIVYTLQALQAQAAYVLQVTEAGGQGQGVDILSALQTLQRQAANALQAAQALAPAQTQAQAQVQVEQHTEPLLSDSAFKAHDDCTPPLIGTTNAPTTVTWSLTPASASSAASASTVSVSTASTTTASASAAAESSIEQQALLELANTTVGDQQALEREVEAEVEKEVQAAGSISGSGSGGAGAGAGAGAGMGVGAEAGADVEADQLRTRARLSIHNNLCQLRAEWGSHMGGPREMRASPLFALAKWLENALWSGGNEGNGGRGGGGYGEGFSYSTETPAQLKRLAMLRLARDGADGRIRGAREAAEAVAGAQAVARAAQQQAQEVAEMAAQQAQRAQEETQAAAEALLERQQQAQRAQLRKAFASLLSLHECSICMDTISCQTSLPCGDCFCYPCISDWAAANCGKGAGASAGAGAGVGMGDMAGLMGFGAAAAMFGIGNGRAGNGTSGGSGGSGSGGAVRVSNCPLCQGEFCIQRVGDARPMRPCDETVRGILDGIGDAGELSSWEGRLEAGQRRRREEGERWEAEAVAAKAAEAAAAEGGRRRGETRGERGSSGGVSGRDARYSRDMALLMDVQRVRSGLGVREVPQRRRDHGHSSHSSHAPPHPSHASHPGNPGWDIYQQMEALQGGGGGGRLGLGIGAFGRSTASANTAAGAAAGARVGAGAGAGTGEGGRASRRELRRQAAAQEGAGAGAVAGAAAAAGARFVTFMEETGAGGGAGAGAGIGASASASAAPEVIVINDSQPVDLGLDSEMEEYMRQLTGRGGRGTGNSGRGIRAHRGMGGRGDRGMGEVIDMDDMEVLDMMEGGMDEYEELTGRDLYRAREEMEMIGVDIGRRGSGRGRELGREQGRGRRDGSGDDEWAEGKQTDRSGSRRSGDRGDRGRGIAEQIERAILGSLPVPGESSASGASAGAGANGAGVSAGASASAYGSSATGGVNGSTAPPSSSSASSSAPTTGLTALALAPPSPARSAPTLASSPSSIRDYFTRGPLVAGVGAGLGAGAAIRSPTSTNELHSNTRSPHSHLGRASSLPPSSLSTLIAAHEARASASAAPAISSPASGVKRSRSDITSEGGQSRRREWEGRGDVGIVSGPSEGSSSSSSNELAETTRAGAGSRAVYDPLQSSFTSSSASTPTQPPELAAALHVAQLPQGNRTQCAHCCTSLADCSVAVGLYRLTDAQDLSITSSAETWLSLCGSWHHPYCLSAINTLRARDAAQGQAQGGMTLRSPQRQPPSHSSHAHASHSSSSSSQGLRPVAAANVRFTGELSAEERRDLEKALS